MTGGTPDDTLPTLLLLGAHEGEDDNVDAGTVRGAKNGRFAALRVFGGSSE
jgi:hypothetical protein